MRWLKVVIVSMRNPHLLDFCLLNPAFEILDKQNTDTGFRGYKSIAADQYNIKTNV